MIIINKMKFREVEKPSNSKLYKVVDLYQCVQPNEDPYPKAYDSRNDLFNHKRALMKESELQLIRAPMLTDFANYVPRKPKLLNEDQPDQRDDRKESISDQQRLINDWKRLIDNEKLSQKSLTFKDVDKDIVQIANQIEAVQESNDKAFRNAKFEQDFVDAKNTLLAKLTERDAATAKDMLRQIVQKASFYNTLYEPEGPFTQSLSVQFAQLHKLSPFVKKSTVGDTFWALIMTNSQSKQNSMIETCMWQLCCKLGLSPDDAYFFTSLEPDANAFKPELKKIVETNTELAGRIELSTIQKALEPIQLLSGGEEMEPVEEGDLVAEIDEGTGGMGVMLYYGDFDNLTQPIQSQKYDLLNHCILSLQTVHHRGSVILKLPDSCTLFNASLAFMMYQLFDSVLVSKPYAAEFDTNEQYLVCSGLRVRKPINIITKLQQVKDQLSQIPVEGCIVLKHMEDEHYFLTYLQQHNDELLFLQTKLLQRALKMLDGLWIPALACYRMKEQLLASFDIPCIQKESDIQLEPEFRASQPEKAEPKIDAFDLKFQNMSKEELQKNVKVADDMLKFLDEQRKRDRKKKQEELKEQAKQKELAVIEERKRKEEEERIKREKVLEKLNQPKLKLKPKKEKPKETNETEKEEFPAGEMKKRDKKAQDKATEKTAKQIDEVSEHQCKMTNNDSASKHESDNKDLHQIKEATDKPTQEPPKKLSVQERIALAKQKEKEKDERVRKAIPLDLLEQLNK